jgi:hypothetical protein
MPDLSKVNANASAIAGGTISILLIDLLIEKGIITHEEARALLTTAQAGLRQRLGDNPTVVEACRIISSVYQRLPKHDA